MKNLLKLELRKLRTKKSFYICTFIMIGILLLTTLITNALAGSDLVGEDGTTCINNMINALGNSYFVMIASIFVAMLVCEDYAGQTIKNIYARGYSRKNVYLAKLIAVLISTTIMVIVVWATSFILGTIFFKVGEVDNYKFLALLGTQYLAVMAEITFAFTIAAIIRKTGGAIACVIVAPMIIGLLLSLADVFSSFEEIYLSELWVSNYLSVVSNFEVTTERILLCFIGSLIYIPIFSLIGFYANKRIQL